MKNALRWIAILPVFVLAYLGVKFIVTTIISWRTPEFISEIHNSRGFAGHPILGSMFLIMRENASTLAAFAGSCIMAPFQRKYVFYTLIGLWIIYVLRYVFVTGVIYGSYGLDWEKVIRGIAELIGQIIGIVIIGVVGSKSNWTFKDT